MMIFRITLLVFSSLALLVSIETSFGQQTYRWAETTIGRFGLDSSWSGPSGTPGFEDEALFGTTLTTTQSDPNVVEFLNSQQNAFTGVASGSFEFRWSNQNLSYTMDDLGIGLDLGAEDLPTTAKLFVGLSPVDQNSGTLTTGQTNIGAAQGHTGELVFSGLGNIWNNSGQINVGLGSDGMLTLSEGAMVNSFNLVNISFSPGTNSQLHLQTNARLEINEVIRVGFSGAAELNVSSGAFLRSVSAEVGRQQGSSGIANIQGNGTIWQVDQSMFLGGDFGLAGGLATLDARDGGLVEIGTRLHLWKTESEVRLTGDGLPGSGGRIIVGESGQPAPEATLYVGNNGTLSGIGTIVGDLLVDGGHLDPGNSPGTLTIDGDVTMQSTSTLELEIGGEQFDEILISQSASFDGSVDVVFLADYVPTLGDEFVLIMATDGIDSFFDANDVTLVNAPTGAVWRVDANSFRVSIVPEPNGLAIFLFVSMVVCIRNRPMRCPR